MSIISDVISGVIAPITNTLQAIVNKKEDVSLEKFKVDGKVDSDLVAAHVAIEQSRNDMRKTYAMQGLIWAFGGPLSFYYGKIHIWDAALHYGVTDAIKGDVAVWDMMVVTFLFGASSLMAWTRKT